MILEELAVESNTMPGLEGIAYVLYYINLDAASVKEETGEREREGFDEDGDGLTHYYHYISMGACYKTYHADDGTVLGRPMFRFASDEPLL